MKNRLRIMFVVCVAALLGGLAVSQQAVAPPPKPVDSGPSLAATMQFIQDKMNEQGQVGFVAIISTLVGITHRQSYLISNVIADPATCTLHTTETTNDGIEVAQGTTYSVGGKPVTGDDLHRNIVETSTFSFKDVEKITVDNMQNSLNTQWAEAAHPEVTVTVTPPVFKVQLSAPKPVFSGHVSITQGNHAPVTKDASNKTNGFTFRDEDMANRVAKAMVHAVELCGGGNKEPF